MGADLLQDLADIGAEALDQLVDVHLPGHGAGFSLVHPGLEAHALANLGLEIFDGIGHRADFVGAAEAGCLDGEIPLRELQHRGREFLERRRDACEHEVEDAGDARHDNESADAHESQILRRWGHAVGELLDDQHGQDHRAHHDHRLADNHVAQGRASLQQLVELVAGRKLRDASSGIVHGFSRSQRRQHGYCRSCYTLHPRR